MCYKKEQTFRGVCEGFLSCQAKLWIMIQIQYWKQHQRKPWGEENAPLRKEIGVCGKLQQKLVHMYNQLKKTLPVLPLLLLVQCHNSSNGPSQGIIKRTTRTGHIWHRATIAIPWVAKENLMDLQGSVEHKALIDFSVLYTHVVFRSGSRNQNLQRKSKQLINVDIWTEARIRRSQKVLHPDGKSEEINCEEQQGSSQQN